MKYKNFNQLNLRESIILSLTEGGYLVPTPVQEESIPLIIARKSIIARAKNGTGKTGAYLIPLLNEISEESKHIQGVVLVPTRELALQVQSLAQKICKFTKTNIEFFIGGTMVKEDYNKIKDRNIQMVVCTPGRLKDLVKKYNSLLDHCEFFVLDEADRLLEGNFERDVEEIVSHVSPKCTMLMYSATFPLRIKSFKEKFMPRAEVINLMDELMLIGMTHYYMLVDEREKLRAIFKIYSSLIINQCIIFCRSNKRAEMLSRKLNEKKYDNEYLHSNMKPDERIKCFERFRKGEFKTLISSNLIARGIDVQTVNVVLNFDFPSESSIYLHRIGRSGRFGQIGLAINLITERDQENVIKIEKELDTKIDPMPPHVDELLYR